MNKKALLPLLLLLAVGVFFSFRLIADQKSILRENSDVYIEPFVASEDANLTKNQAILQTISRVISEGHFSPKDLNDDFSKRVFKRFLEMTDYGKLFFTKSDIDDFMKYETTIDDEIKSGSTELYDTVSQRFKIRLKEAEAYYKEGLAEVFTFTGNEEIELDGKKMDWCADQNALKSRWKINMKYRTLSRYIELKDEQKAIAEKKTKEKTDTIKTDVQLEKDARLNVGKSMATYFKRINKIGDNDRFASYMNSICHVVDPHTDFFPPKDKQRFDEEMSGSFVGIGARLLDKEGVCKIESVLPGSPCAKDGRLKKEDIIMKVAQGSEDPVDIAGWDLEDIVSIIRGKINTEVRLTVKHADGSIEVIPIIRGKVETEATFAKSVIIKADNQKIGYILLPEFYADFNDRNGRRCKIDMQKEVEKLMAEKVNGIIIDLRTNGGGSLDDVVEIGGMFIDKGPIVQVKSRNAMAEALRDEVAGVLYDGPLAILVSQGSASASEILAAAIQDYHRGIVIGSTTFGKGTVQRIFPLEGFYQGDQSLLPFGSIKLTLQKFYRINGGSTQLKGVTPDITIPDLYDKMDVGERKDSNSMPWDQIAKADYKPLKPLVDFNALIELSRKRIHGNEAFKLISQSSDRLKKQSDENKYSLNQTKFQQQMKEAKDFSKKLEDLEKNKKTIAIQNVAVDLPLIAKDTLLTKSNEDWIKALKKDPYVAEASNVLVDWNKLLKENSTGSIINSPKN
ncbi:MAG: carboxy terminal-processing peptidase [Bacteroidetes bacterium]|nr:carboxy terminal-processing peptidase [Bacteroidota bacterium]